MVSIAKPAHENFCVFWTFDFHRFVAAPAAAPPSAAHPTLPAPAVAARHPAVTTPPTTPPMISAWYLLTNRVVAFQAELAFFLAEFHADLIDHSPDGSQ
jgi:hypothetical protein